MRVDSHQHFIKYKAEDYPWIDDRLAPLKRDFLPEHLKPLLDESQFDATVIVQARQSLEETEWILKIAEETEWVRGVVGWVDLCADDVGEQLQKYAQHPKFKGVRHQIHDEPDDRFMMGDRFLNGLQQTFDLGLTFDLLLFPRHLPIAVELVEYFPGQPFVLDHISKPDIKNGVMEPWKTDFSRLAQYENVYCKLSGMVTEADWHNWKQSDFVPYLEVAMEQFGPKRLMIGSDWPVCTVSRDYKSVMNIVIDFLKSYPEEVQKDILGRNCMRFYKL